MKQKSVKAFVRHRAGFNLFWGTVCVTLLVLCVSQAALALKNYALHVDSSGAWNFSNPLGKYRILPLKNGTFQVVVAPSYKKIYSGTPDDTQIGSRSAQIQGEEDATVDKVPAASLKATLPGVTVDNVSTTIMFDEGPAPGVKRVNVYWNQSNSTAVGMVLIDKANAQLITPYDFFIDQGYINENFNLPIRMLRRPMIAFFFKKGAGAVVPIRSLAWADYNLIMSKTNLEGFTFPLDSQDKRTIGYLERVDPSIVGKPNKDLSTSDDRKQHQVPNDGGVVKQAAEPPTPQSVAVESAAPAIPTEPRLSALETEFAISKAYASRELSLVYINVTPKRNIEFTASDFELSLPNGTVVLGHGFENHIKLVAGSTRQILVQFGDVPSQDVSKGKIHLYYTAVP